MTPLVVARGGLSSGCEEGAINVATTFEYSQRNGSTALPDDTVAQSTLSFPMELEIVYWLLNVIS